VISKIPARSLDLSRLERLGHLSCRRRSVPRGLPKLAPSPAKRYFNRSSTRRLHRQLPLFQHHLPLVAPARGQDISIGHAIAAAASNTTSTQMLYSIVKPSFSSDFTHRQKRVDESVVKAIFKPALAE
jgi:hypothetical protein